MALLSIRAPREDGRLASLARGCYSNLFYSILIIFCKGGNFTVKIDDPLMVKAVAG